MRNGIIETAEDMQKIKQIEKLEKLLKECKGVIDECVRSDYIEELKERIDEVLKCQ